MPCNYAATQMAASLAGRQPQGKWCLDMSCLRFQILQTCMYELPSNGGLVSHTWLPFLGLHQELGDTQEHISLCSMIAVRSLDLDPAVCLLVI